MNLYQQRRAFLFGSVIVTIRRTIKEAVGRGVSGGRKFNGLWNGKVSRVDTEIVRTSQDVKGAGKTIEPNKLSRFSWRSDPHNGHAVRSPHIPDIGVRRFNGFKIFCFSVDERQTKYSTVSICADDSFGRLKAVAGHAEAPLRHAKLSFHLVNRFDIAFRKLSVKVPPSASIGNEVENAIRRPFRLEDRLLGAARNFFRVRYQALFIKTCRPQFTTVPGHVGMVPRQPGQA